MRIRGLALFLVALVSIPGSLGLRASGQDSKDTPAPATDSPATPQEAPKLDLTPDADGKLSQEQMQQLVRMVVNNYIENNKRLRDYTYTVRDVQNKLDGKEETKSTEVKTFDVLEIDGEQVWRLIEKDDKPLDAKEAAKEDEKIQKLIDKRKNESEDDRKKREQKEGKEREDNLKFLLETGNAYNFKLVGTEAVGGRDAWVLEGEPRPEFEPQIKDAKILSKFHGRVWVDKDDLQLSKMDVEAIDTVSFGWVLARIHKGTHMLLEQTRVNDEVWLPQHVSFKLDMRVALLKGYKIDGEQTFSDYKKFRTSAKIVGVGEVKDPPKDPDARQ